jgi:hypothetical protein
MKKCRVPPDKPTLLLSYYIEEGKRLKAAWLRPVFAKFGSRAANSRDIC